MTDKSENNSNGVDVWSSIRNLKKKMKGSKNENDLSVILQKSQNSTKLSSNSSMISQRDLIGKQSNQDLEESKSNFYSKKASETENTQIDIDYATMENYSSGENRSYFQEIENIKHENGILKSENAKLHETISSLVRENQKNFANFQKMHQQEYEEKINYYETEVRTLKEAFQREMENKEEEIASLNSLVMNKNQNNSKINEKTLIQNYENMINILKNDFQNEIFRLKKEHLKQLNGLIEEKSVMEKILEELQKEVNRLRYLELYTKMIPEDKENFGMEDNHPQKSLRKKHNDKNIENLLSKISKCMNENFLTESDFNLTSKNDTNAHLKSHFKDKGDRNLFGESQLMTDTMSKLVVAEEFPASECSENEEVYALPKNKETEGNLSVEQEDIFWMNYSIKDLNEKIRMAKKQ